MVKFVKGALLAGVVSLALTGIASAETIAAVSDAEFKCQQAVNKNGAKFTGAKAKCISKCLTTAWKAAGAGIDACYPPYGELPLDATDLCITDVLKGAATKFGSAIVKACTGTGKECPSCYGGDCSVSAYASDQVQTISGQIDSFVPGVACETGADKAEQGCMTNTSKVLVKQVGSITKCYDKCEANARKNLVTQASCAVPATDPATAACITKSNDKTTAGVNKKCGDVAAIPDCAGTDDYPTGADWTNLVNIAIVGNIPNTFCNSPSGAFVD